METVGWAVSISKAHVISWYCTYTGKSLDSLHGPAKPRKGFYTLKGALCRFELLSGYNRRLENECMDAWGWRGRRRGGRRHAWADKHHTGTVGWAMSINKVHVISWYCTYMEKSLESLHSPPKPGKGCYTLKGALCCFELTSWYTRHLENERMDVWGWQGRW